MTDATSALLDEFFAAIERGDLDAVERLYADDIEVWHNVTGRTMDKAANKKLLGFWSSAVDDMRYEVLERRTYEGGATQRHVIHGSAAGSPLRADICIVFHVSDGQITRIYEYLDPAAVAQVFGEPRSRESS
jgi:ketosteroid isomerase-like protein